MPRRRKCSIERALVLLHLGCCAVSSWSVTRTAGTARQWSSIAAARPTGPPPTMSAKVSASNIRLWARDRAHARSSARRCQAAGEKLAAVAQSVLIDAVADAVGHVPFDRDAERGEPARGVEQRLRGDEIVAVAVDEQHRRTRLDLGRELLRIDVGRDRQQSGIADDCERHRRAAQPYMQRHHRALAEADERERRGREIAALELGVEEG